MDIGEIIKAWSIAINPTQEQLLLSQKRYSVCNECEFLKQLPKIKICGKCLCPIHKKIFTENVKLMCPIGKWDNIK